MPHVPIVDAHVHLWDPHRFRMSWLDGNRLLDQRYGLEEYRQQTADVLITGMVYLQVDVEAAYGLLEAAWAADRAREEPRLQAIVPFAPLEFGEQARAYLEALLATSPLIRGVRRLLQAEPLEFCLQPRFIRGVQLLAEYDLSFDLCLYHPQLANALQLVKQCPETAIILDHIGKPAIRDGLLEPWKQQVSAMAAFPNVWCKVSGMVTEAIAQQWKPDDLRPYLDHVLEEFGEDRVVFGGDWPVVLQASSYQRWVETLDALTTSLSPEAQRKLWGDNARRFYRLDAAHSTGTRRTDGENAYYA